MWFRAFILVFVSALCVAPTHGDDSTVKKLVGDFYHQIKRPKHNAIAKSTAQKIIELGRLKKDKTLRARGILRLAYVNFAADKETDWKSSFASCEQLTPPESLARAEFLLFRGIVKIRCKDIRHGLRDLEDSIWISQQNRNDDLLSYAHAFYAEHLLRSGSVDRALHHGFQGLTIAEHINNPTAEYYCVAALMRTFTAANQKEDAVEYALRLRELDPESVQADWILIDSEDAEVIASIEPRIEKAVSGDSTGKDKFELASNQLALAQIRKTQKRTSEAKELFDLASENYHAYGSSKNADLAHYQKTLMLYENNDSDTSMKDLFRAANRRAPPIVARQVAEDMSKTLGAQGRFREAYHWGRRHIKTNRNQTSRQIADAKKAASSSWASELRSRDQQEKILTQQNEAWKSLLFNCGLTSLGVGIGFLGLIRFRRLKRSSSKLEHLVDARTRSLRLAQEEAQMADMAKSEFLARVNHELRNPLTAILGYCELLEMSPDTQETKDQYLDGLRTSSQHLLDLVGEVLDVAKIADGQIAIQQKNFDLHETCDDVYGILGKQATEKGLKFECRAAPNCFNSLFGDNTILKQILLNLIGNAIKYTETGSVSAIVETKDETSTDLILRMTFTDSGIGISPDNQVAVFSPFFQTKQSANTGKGLGLHICKCLVNHLGGTIALTSVPGQGTQVIVEIPYCKATENSKIADSIKLLDDKFQSRKIMVVDDQQVIREVVSGQLNSIGHDSKPCFGMIEQILKQLEKERPDLILLDLRMPANDGFEVFESICEKFGDSRPTVIAMTGDATDFVKARVDSCGFDGFLAKPFRISKLNSTLERCESLRTDSQTKLRRSG